MFGNPYVELAVLAIVGIGLGIYYYLKRNNPPVDWTDRESQQTKNQRWLNDLINHQNQ